MTSDDIVPRLRLWADGLEKQHAVSLAVAIREAADEIELLRAERGTARHGVICAIETLMHAVEERETIRAKLREAADAIGLLRDERDEARREVCGLLVACHTDPDDEEPDPNLKHVHAEIRGWDCFKENA